MIRPRALSNAASPGLQLHVHLHFFVCLAADNPQRKMTQETHAHVQHACWMMEHNVPDTCERTFPPNRTLLKKKWKWRASPFTQTGIFVEQSLIYSRHKIIDLARLRVWIRDAAEPVCH